MSENKKLIEALKKAREKDPGFKKAIQAWIDAEAKHGASDPAEGKPVKRKPPTP